MPLALVTGAFSNIGSAVARELLARGWTVRTLTNRPSPPTSPIEAIPLRFEREHLDVAFANVDAFVNTYWVRFPYRGVTFEDAVANTRALIGAARRQAAGKFVQVSVSNAGLDSPLGYYHGKAQVEHDLRTSGLDYGIVRPTLVVGPNDVLTNNMAWFLRRFPIIGVPRGDGYRLQPVTLEECGRIITDVLEGPESQEVDAAGPETFTFREYLMHLAQALQRRPRFVAVPPRVMLAGLNLMGRVVHDVVLTREELRSLELGMLVSHHPPLGRERVSGWLAEHGANFGVSYANDTLHRFGAD